MITNPTPQRALRGHLPRRPTPRLATTGEHHARLAGRLTSRDRWLARMLHEHRVLTTHQITELAFPSLRAANHRLLDLFKWRVVDRFQPFITTGTAPMHYVLDIAGAVALAYEDGLDPKQTGYRHADAIGIAHSLQLAHTVGINGFFSSLVALSRRPGARGRLTTWWSERRCGRLFGDIVRPDAYGRWHEDRHQIEFFLEYDFGTEDLTTLARKLHRYENLAVATAITTPVLVWLPTTRRETTARHALTTVLAELDHAVHVPVATTSANLSVTHPAAARWLPLSNPTQHPTGRLALVDLAHLWPYTGAPTPIKPPNARPAPVELAPPAPLPPAPTTDHFRR
ncbi:replication-relaxation family protein [Saccharothrix saharensis]|uniref:replication-relaxation family protein n=1 Tax=Saccharothrix saharensis TaxID=571190 RepID=UPI0036776134